MNKQLTLSSMSDELALSPPLDSPFFRLIAALPITAFPPLTSIALSSFPVEVYVLPEAVVSFEYSVTAL